MEEKKDYPGNIEEIWRNSLPKSVCVKPISVTRQSEIYHDSLEEGNRVIVTQWA